MFELDQFLLDVLRNVIEHLCKSKSQGSAERWRAPANLSS